MNMYPMMKTRPRALAKFYLQNPASPTMVIIHGLNLSPLAMAEFEKHFLQQQFNVAVLSLNGHRGDKDQLFLPDHHQLMQNELKVAIEEIKTHTHGPLMLLGKSLGALCALNQSHHFDKLILLAPPVYPKRFPNYLLKTLLRFLPRTFPIPSLNSKDYRLYSSIPLNAYQSLIHLNHSHHKALLQNENCLVILHERDELIDSALYKEHKAQLRLMPDNQSRPKRFFHHLMISAHTLGQANWQKVLQEIDRHIRK